MKGMEESNVHNSLHVFEGAKFRTTPTRGLAVTTNNQGDPSCPCLSIGEVDPISYENTPESTMAILGLNGINISSYGFGCAAHDVDSAVCADWNVCMASKAKTDCDEHHGWCSKSFCYVDPHNCALLKTPSVYFTESDRHFSYATCGDVDIFNDAMIVSKLSGKNIRIGLNHVPGGIYGAYQKDKMHLTGPLEAWRGPILDFVLEASATANFTVELVEPPEVIRNKSSAYWGESPFDKCVYAAALGYVDLCISTYVLTSKRASVTPWMIMTERSLHLVVSDDKYDIYFGLRGFVSSLGTIFLPFTTSTWVFLIFFAIPVMGGLFVWHEYHKPDSLYQSTTSFLVADHEKGDFYVETQKVPLYQSIGRTTYMAFLSVLTLNYAPSLVSAGSKFHVLGMASFILTLSTVYVAKLVTIITHRVNKVGINNLNDAIGAGYRICCTRKVYEVVSGIYRVPPEAFTKDPIELGGDGKPGFDCPNCKISTRPIEYLDPVKAETDENYCHAALSFAEHLESFHAEGKYCHLKFVPGSIALVPDGLPIFEGISQELLAHFFHEKNRGLWNNIREAATPSSICPIPKYSNSLKNASLTIFDLMGIWTVSSLFIFLGVITTCTILPFLKRRGGKKKRFYPHHLYNQYGVKLENEKANEVISHLFSLPFHKCEVNDTTWPKRPNKQLKRPHNFIRRHQPTTLSTEESNGSLVGILRPRFHHKSPQNSRAGSKRKIIHETVSACNDDNLRRRVRFEAS